MKQTLLLPLLTIATAFVTGCYTQLTTIDKTPPPAPQEQVEWVVDSATGDTVKVVKQVDTIRTENNQTCIWERDLMGYPHLRCYDSFYPRDWFYYNNSPWWYRNDPYWYDYSRCPRYYYYDPSIGRCRYTTDFYHTGRRYYDRDGIQYEKKEPNGPSGSSMSPRVRGIVDPKSSGSSKRSTRVKSSADRKSATTTSKRRETGDIIVPASKGDEPSRSGPRNRGLSNPSTKTSSGTSSSTSSSEVPKKASTSSSPPTKSEPSIAPSNGRRRSPPPDNNGNKEEQQRRRRPRSW